jgi:hypothetical protein
MKAYLKESWIRLIIAVVLLSFVWRGDRWATALAITLIFLESEVIGVLHERLLDALLERVIRLEK